MERHMTLSQPQIAHIRMLKSGIITPFEDIEQCISHLFGIQSQAQQFGEISILNRVKKGDCSELNTLYQSHKLIKIWGQRMTVHMYCRDDWKYVHQVYAQRNSFVKRGWQAHEAIFTTLMSDIDRFMLQTKKDKKELTAFINQSVGMIEHPYREYSAIIQSCLNGTIFAVPQSPQTKYFAHRSLAIHNDDFEHWQTGQESALDELLMRYFNGYGPATLKDFCHWSGLNQGEIQPAFQRIKDNLIELTDNNKRYYLPLADSHLLEQKPPARFVKLLGKFDPLFVSFSDKSWIASPVQQKAIWRPAAHVEAVLLVNEKLSATWRYAIKGKKIDFTFYLFHAVSQSAKKGIEAEAQKIADFLGKTLNGINYI
jgi:hypothetical protein